MSSFVRQALSSPRPLFGLGAVASALVALGCQSPQHFTDTEGRNYVAECKDDQCSYRFVEAAPSPAGASSPQTVPPANVTLRSTGHLLAVCEGDKAKGTACRAVSCTDACPSDPAGNKASCQRGLCVNEGSDLTNEDVLLLCIAGTGTKRSAQQAARIALARSCGTPCKLPAACRQP